MTAEEMIESCKNDWPDRAHNIVFLVDALEEYYLNGSYDDLGGDSEAPTGHYYRQDRWIVVTDSQGFRHVEPYDTEEKAQEAFEEKEKEYSEWGEKDETDG